MLIVEAASARARERGVSISISYMQSEDLATQAILNGLADAGIGTPYALIQKTGAPIRMIYQLSTLRFFPVVNTDYYQNWQDLDGADMYSHGKGSGTEAIMQLMAAQRGIQYRDMIYIPGSGVRANAMIKGRIHATIVDTQRRNKLLKHPSGKFKVLPIPALAASDEAVYANTSFLQANREAIAVFLQELLQVNRAVNHNPAYLLEARERYSLLLKETAGKERDILQMYTELVAVNAIPAHGGGQDAALADFEFYSRSGTLHGQPGDFKLEDYWDLTPLRAALAALPE